MLVLCCLPLAALAENHWAQFQSGPFELWTDGSARQGRETLAQFEQLRFVIGQMLGEPDLSTQQPIRILMFRSAKESGAHVTSAAVIKGRDRHAIILTAGRSVPATVFRQCAALFLASSAGRMPPEIERGLTDLFATIEISGTHVSVGRSLPPAEQSRDWALVHLLVTRPEYYGKLRVLLFNLRNGLEPDPAFRNAFGKSAKEIETEAARHLANGDFQAVPISGKAMRADFPEKPVESSAVPLALADLLGQDAEAMYRQMIQEKTHVAEAYEGLGVLSLKAKQTEAARRNFLSAIDAGAKSAGVAMEYARLEQDNTKAVAALENAARLNPKLAEPHYLLAEREPDRKKRIEHLNTATSLEPRNAQYWQALAEACLADNSFAAAAKAWRGAEQASNTEEQRARMRLARLAIEGQRLDYEDAERKRVAAEKEREIQKLKAAAIAEVRALEARVNKGSGFAADQKVVPWWDGPKPPGQATGRLKQVDCLGKQARVVIITDAQTPIRLLIRDPSQVPIIGGGERTLSCGPQKPRRVIVAYYPKRNAKTTTAGEVATIEFQ